MYTIALDPGNDAGIAIFNGERRLLYATVADFKDREKVPRKGGHSVCGALGLIQGAVVQIIYERPVVRRPGDSPASPESIVTLSITLGKWLGYLDTRLAGSRLVQYEHFTPEQWKRNIPKEVSEHRARKLLQPAELALADEDLGRLAPSIRHNGWDAIALGLVGINRAKAGVLPRIL